MLRHSFASIALGLILLAAGGCTSASKGTLTVTGNESRQLFAQSFNHAFISTNHAGEFDVVMLQEIGGEKPADPGMLSKAFWMRFWPGTKDVAQPIKPMGDSEFRQMVHIHIFWQAVGGSVAKDGVVTNAAIDWYVIGQGEVGKPEVLRYQGAGYVILDEGRKSTTVEVRDGAMKKTNGTSAMTDPIGPSRLVGKVSALRDTQAVANLLSDLKAHTNKAGDAVSVAK